MDSNDDLDDDCPILVPVEEGAADNNKVPGKSFGLFQRVIERIVKQQEGAFLNKSLSVLWTLSLSLSQDAINKMLPFVFEGLIIEFCELLN